MTKKADKLLELLFNEEASVQKLATLNEPGAYAWVLEEGKKRDLEVTQAEVAAALANRDLPDALLAAAAGGGATGQARETC